MRTVIFLFTLISLTAMGNARDTTVAVKGGYKKHLSYVSATKEFLIFASIKTNRRDAVRLSELAITISIYSKKRWLFELENGCCFKVKFNNRSKAMNMIEQLKKNGARINDVSRGWKVGLIAVGILTMNPFYPLPSLDGCGCKQKI